MPERSTVEVDGRRLSLSNLDKVLYPDGFTKGEVVDYYARIAPALLPHVTGRPMSFQRFPDGTDRYAERRHASDESATAVFAGLVALANRSIANHRDASRGIRADSPVARSRVWRRDCARAIDPDGRGLERRHGLQADTMQMKRTGVA